MKSQQAILDFMRRIGPGVKVSPTDLALDPQFRDVRLARIASGLRDFARGGHLTWDWDMQLGEVFALRRGRVGGGKRRGRGPLPQWRFLRGTGSIGVGAGRTAKAAWSDLRKAITSLPRSKPLDVRAEIEWIPGGKRRRAKRAGGMKPFRELKELMR